MNQTFTPLDLVRFLYNETSNEESFSIAVALESDEVLNREFQEMQKAHSQLSALTFAPSSALLDEIINYSAAASMDEYVH